MIKNDVGFIIPNLQNDKFSISICELIAHLINNNKKNQFCIFNQYSDLLDTKSVPLITISHARYFSGDIVVLDFPSLLMCINFPLIKTIHYFTNNIPWLNAYNEYNTWKKIFNKNNLRIYTGKTEITDIYNLLWNSNAKTIQEINYETFLSIL